MLLGRDRERQHIAEVLGAVTQGRSAALAIVGEPGIGKTALLDEARERATGMRILRARGVQSEAEIPFASLFELLRPALAEMERIPRPQAVALESALALRPARAQERFAVGAATLSLLAAHAESGPVAVIIDDAQWLDDSSAQALLFAIRRLLADPVAVVIAARAGEASLLDEAGLPTVTLSGLSATDTATLLSEIPTDAAARLHQATGGNPLALLELAGDLGADGLGPPAPPGAPILLPKRLAGLFVRRLRELDEAARAALTLAATSDTGELALLTPAARRLDIDLSTLAAAATTGLVSLQPGFVEFRHPLARSAVYADAPPEQRRAAHRALASSLPDRDVDRRAWHLAAAAVGADDAAATALIEAAHRARARSAYSAAATALERAARLTASPERRGRLLADAADAAWLAGLADRADALVTEARPLVPAGDAQLHVDELAAHITIRRGPLMRGKEMLAAVADRADAERAVALLAEAAGACFYAGDAREMVAVAERAQARLPEPASARARFLCATAVGMAGVLGGDAAAGATRLHEAVTLAASDPELRDDVGLLPWLAIGPIFLREAAAGRDLLEHAVALARERAAVGALPFLLQLIARDHATTDRWALAGATYREAIALARECGQQTTLVFGLSGLAWMQARRGAEAECRAFAAEALALSATLGTRLHEVWATAALGELELAKGDARAAADAFEHQDALLGELQISDPDLSPAPELVDVYVRLGQDEDAARHAARFSQAAQTKAQPWSLARALRAQMLVAGDEQIDGLFTAALGQHQLTPDAFETARTQLAYGERLRRARQRVRARAPLGAAIDTFERLDARPWASRAAAELAATGETLRRSDPATADDLTPQELQIAHLLAEGRTTREAAAALFLSPKTIEYHLRHVYLKLGINSREQLALALASEAE